MTAIPTAADLPAQALSAASTALPPRRAAGTLSSDSAALATKIIRRELDQRRRVAP